jgi:hypothetical protein
LVEYKAKVKAGLNGGQGVMINEWRSIKKESTQKVPAYKIQSTRQLLSTKEVEMVKKGMDGKQDYVIVAARGLMRIGGIDDVLRRSFKNYLEAELKINVYVWITHLRHAGDKGMIRDEPIMIGLVSEGGGDRLGGKIRALERGKRKAMIMMEGVDIQLFRDVQSIWNTKKPGLVGAADRYIEMVGPGECDGKEVLSILAEMGVSKVCMMAKTSKMRGKPDEVWTIVPARGETLLVKQIKRDERRWDAHEYMRPKDSGRMETGHTSWAMGVMHQTELRTNEEGEAETISSITSLGTNMGTTVSSVSRNEDTTISSIVKSFDNRLNREKEEMRAMHLTSLNNEREKTRVDMTNLRTDLIDAIKKDKEDRREEAERSKRDEEERWERRLRDIMGVIGVMGIKNNNNNV